jgi:hypothetical protein
VIASIVIFKYWDDILDVFVRDRGHLPYNDDGTTIGSKDIGLLNKKIIKREEKNE